MKIAPLAAVATLVAAAAAYEIATWPDVGALARQNPSSTAFIDRYQEDQRRAHQSADLWWLWVPPDRISPNLKRAVIVSEDMAFFTHHGFDVAELWIAVRDAARAGATPRGASTISQQLAKNLWLSPSRNPLRKLKEAMLTHQLESHLTKARILELYLNVVEFGRGVYGAEAAARRYFGKSAADLTEHEAALLAASLPRPGLWNPERQSRAYSLQVGKVEERMTRATFLRRWIAGGVDSMPLLTVDSVLLDSLLRSVRADQVPPDATYLDELPRDTLRRTDSTPR